MFIPWQFPPIGERAPGRNRSFWPPPHCASSFPLQPWDACEGIEQPLTDELTQDYAALAAEAVTADVAPEDVEVMNVLQSGTWSVAYVGTPVADPGYMFFEEVDRQKRFKDVWGGMASASERPEITAWAEELGAPADLATCFAEMAATDDDG